MELMLNRFTKANTPAAATAGVFFVLLLPCCLEFYFLRPFSHLQIILYSILAVIPAATETRNENKKLTAMLIGVTSSPINGQEPATVKL